MARADKPIETDSDILDPVTVKAGEDDTDAEDSEPDDAAEQPTPLGSEQRQPVPAAARGEQQQGRAGDAAPRRGPRTPRDSSWKNNIDKMITSRTSKYEKTIGELRQSLAQMEGRYQALTQMGQGGQQQQSGPTQELAAIGKEMQDIAKLAANPNLTDDQRGDLANRYQSLDDKRLEMRSAAVAERIVAERLRQQQSDAPSQEEAIGLTILATEYPRLSMDQAAKAEARHYFNYLVARNGGQETPDIFREACQYVYTQRGWAAAPSQRPNGRERGMFEAAPGNGRSTNGNDGSITFQPDDLRVMRGAPVSPEQVADQMRVMKQRGW